MKTKLLSLAMAMVMLFTLLPVTAQAKTEAGVWGDNLIWTFDEGTETLTFSGTGEMEDALNYWRDDNRPWKDFPVKTVVLEEGITTVGFHAFSELPTLQTVMLPTTLTRIDGSAFMDSTGLCGIITVPEGVTEIGLSAFSGCTSLEGIVVPATVTEIGDSAFRDCGSLQYIKVSESNPEYASDAQGALYSKDMSELICAPGGFEGAFQIPDSVTWIWESAFYGCVHLTSIAIPDRIDSLYEYTFYGCTSLKEVKLSESITRINSNTFAYCTSLETIVIPGSVKVIDFQAFAHCISLSSMALSEGIEEIGIEAFRNTGLQEVTIPASLNAIGYDAFDSCKQMVAYHVSEDSPYFAADAQGALYNKEMTELYYVPAQVTGEFVIPEKVYWINSNTSGDGANYEGAIFAYCTKLTAISVAEENETFWSEDGILYGDYRGYYHGILNNEYGTYLLRCPIGYSASTVVHVPEGITEVYSGIFGAAFQNCSNLTDLYIPAQTEFSTYSLEGCISLLNVWVEEGHAKYICVDGVLFNRKYNDSSYYYMEMELEIGDKEELRYFPEGRTGYYELPESTRYLPGGIFTTCNLSALKIPTEVQILFPNEFAEADKLSYLMFTGEKPTVNYSYDSDLSGLVLGKDIIIYYPDWLESWEEPELHDESCTVPVTYVPYAMDNAPVWNGTALAPKPSSEPTPSSNPFTDVTENHWFAEPVLWAVEHDITNGMTATTFGPDAVCTRAQIVTFLWRAMGEPKPASTENPFIDVKAGQWYTDAVLWALEQGITTGKSATVFGTDDPCERAAVVTFLWRTMGKPQPTSTSHPFTDANANDWYGKAMLWAVENDITDGMTATTFAPTAHCTRAQIVTFLYRAFA